MATQLPAGVNLDSPQIKFWIECDQAFKQMKVDSFANFLHKDFRFVLLPRSLGEPEKTKDVWLEQIKGIIGVITGFESTVHSIIEAPGKVIVHATGSAKSPTGTATNEGVTIIHLVTDEDGSLKIKKMEEFRDSKAHLETVAMIMAAQANK